MSRSIDLSGKTFGSLTAIRKVGVHYSHAVWECRCRCGSVINVISGNLTSKKKRKPNSIAPSCRNCQMARFIKHGNAHAGNHSSEYVSWSGMLYRCYRKSGKSYKHYGGRGITVCARWQKSFENFLEDMGRKPSPSHSIDRINNDGNYEPKNCRWATPLQQVVNSRRTKIITINGETMILKEWAARVGRNQSTLSHRANSGFGHEGAIRHYLNKLILPS